MAASLLASFLELSSLLSPCLSAEPKVLGLSFEVERHQVQPSELEKRASVVGGELLNLVKVGYWANITIGTPPQYFRVHIDTGSNNISESSTGNDLQGLFDISYMDGRGVNGTYITDTVGLYGVSLENVQMGLALNSKTPSAVHGVPGIGFDRNEAETVSRHETPYPNTVSQLQLQGHINSRAYSFWLDDYNNMNLRVSLDTGSTFTLLPKSLTEYLYVKAGVFISDGIPLIPCDSATATANLSFGFGGSQGIQIKVPFSELVFPSVYQGYFSKAGPNKLTFSNGSEACEFAFGL
ncbi:MAG: hypothetical protein Q9166_004965 [cf. Caloplaca sp. 2 TL-2023]